MMKTYASFFRTISARITNTSSTLYWSERIRQDFGLKCGITKSLDAPHLILRQAYNILEEMGQPLVKACGISKLIFRDDMGPNKSYYPNHGYFHDDSVTINSDIFVHPDQPDDFFDHRGYFLTRGAQTIIHEMGHAFDAAHGDLSLKPAWLKLSGWSETPKKGLKRIIITEPGTPDVIGEMFYDPKAEFTRFYGKRNSWDDFADCFSFFVAGLKEKVPEKKRDYMKNLIKDYAVKA